MKDPVKFVRCILDGLLDNDSKQRLSEVFALFPQANVEALMNAIWDTY